MSRFERSGSLNPNSVLITWMTQNNNARDSAAIIQRRKWHAMILMFIHFNVLITSVKI